MIYNAPFDLNTNELRNTVVQNLAAAPTRIAGRIYYDTVLGQFGVGGPSTWLYMGTVTTLSVTAANGFGGTVANAGTTPAITITTSVTGLLKGNGTGVVAATAGTDYLTPTGDGSGLSGLTVGQVSGAAPLASPTFTGTPAAPTATPGTNTTQLATTAFVSAAVSVLASGRAWKDPVFVRTTGNITLSGTQTIDGVAVTAGKRVAVFDQTTTTQDGIYLCAAGAWTRTDDFLTGTDQASSSFYVQEGTTYQDKQFTVTNAPGGATVGTDNLILAQTGSGTTYTADEASLTLTGATFSVKSDWVGQTSITTLGTITTGTWSATTIAVNKGGTGQTTAAAARGTSGLGAGTAAANGTNTTCVSRGIARVCDGTYTGTGAATSFALTHNLGTQSVVVQVKDSSNNVIGVDCVATDNNTITITHNPAPANTVVYTVTIIGY